ncbi:hypothetical protein CV100_06355 [Stenotrophomonas maltophilia]|nr:hypothetical protein CV100_06355 [Stenotrophomonas maltophilia]
MGEFPVREQCDGIFWARELLQTDASKWKRVQMYASELDELCGAEIDLSKYPDVDTRLAADVSRAILFTTDARRCIAALAIDLDGEVDAESWDGFWKEFVIAVTRAEKALVHANKQCIKALSRMSIENSWR